MLTAYKVSGAIVSDGTLREYWRTNGKSFDWAGLPTELKEHIIQFCIGKAPNYPDNFHDLKHLPRSNFRYHSHGCEVTDRLGEWKRLLEVSTLVRAITLRLCFSGSLVSFLISRSSHRC